MRLAVGVVPHEHGKMTRLPRIGRVRDRPGPGAHAPARRDARGDVCLAEHDRVRQAEGGLGALPVDADASAGLASGRER